MKRPPPRRGGTQTPLVVINPSLLRGECLCCDRVSLCAETSLDRVKNSFTCSLFTPILEPVYQARLQAMRLYGEDRAILAMMARPPSLDTQGEEPT